MALRGISVVRHLEMRLTKPLDHSSTVCLLALSLFPSPKPVHIALWVTAMVAAGGDANAETRPLARGDGLGLRVQDCWAIFVCA